MANKIPASVTRHPWGNAQVDKMGAVGVTAEEMKVRTGAGLPAPEVGPIAQAGPMEFTNPTRSSDNLRLAVPNTENPFTTTPWGRSMIMSWLRVQSIALVLVDLRTLSKCLRPTGRLRTKS